MKLIESLETQGLVLSEVMILVRHGVDVSTLSQDLNQPLTEETKPDIRILSSEIVDFCKRLGIVKVDIHSSNRLRAIQTSEIVAEEFFTANIPIKIYETIGIREIYQGNFIIKEDHIHGEEYKPLLDAWSIWQQKLDASELLYRFGDPVISGDGKVEYPELVGWFKEFGENQREFSLRLYLFLLKMFEGTNNNLQIIIGHQASCSRIQRIISAASRLESANEFKFGEFVKFLEKQGKRITIEPACGVVVRKPNRTSIISVLQKEIEYLKSII